MKRKFIFTNRVEAEDWKDLLPLFQTRPFDRAAYEQHVEARYGGSPELSLVMRTAGECIVAVESGLRPDLSAIKLLHAKHLLSVLVTAGKMRAARAMLEVAKAWWNPDRFKAHDALVLDQAENDGDIDIADRVWEDFQVLDFGGETTFILFCGIAARFGVELNVMRQWVRPTGANLIYVRDRANLLYLTGIDSLGDEAASVAGIKAALAKLGSKRTVCVGNSGGTFGALYYGHLLGADQIICFSGPTNLEAGLQEKADRPVYELIHQLTVEGKVTKPDLVALYAENEIPVRYFFGDKSEFDVVQASHVKHLPNASLEPLDDWDGHFVIGELARRGKLAEIFRRAAEV